MSLRVLSLNVWALPAPVGRDVAERMERINAELPRLDADVVLYQEVWTEDARQRLIEGGRRAGHAHVWHRDVARGGSGLLVLSRAPLSGATFHRYTLCGLPQRIAQADYYSGKGFVQLVVSWEGVPVTLFGTHMHARYAPEGVVDDYQGHRVGEVVELASAIRAVRGPVVAVGDFNLSDDSPEYTILLGLTQLVDAAARLDVRLDTATLTNPYRKSRGATSASRIDYVFVRDGERDPARALSVERVLDGVFELHGAPATYSDHAGLLAEISFAGDRAEARAGAPAAPPASVLSLARELLRDGRERARDRRRFERVAAGGAFATAVVGAGALRARALSRRRFLRAAALAGAGVAAVSGVGLLALSEHYVDVELDGYAEVEDVLDALDGRRAAHRADSAPWRSLA